MQTRVLIADDRCRFRSGLRAVLALRPEIEIVGEEGCAAEQLLAAITGQSEEKKKGGEL